MAAFEFVVAERGEYLDDAASIWADATAARDGDAEIASRDVARAVIERVVNSSARSLLLVAMDRDHDVVGFAAAEPVDPARERRVELRYIGVRPGAWGGGVGTGLLAALRDALRSRGFVDAQLWVYCDNRRAVGLYRRGGWKPSRNVRLHPRSGKREQLYTLGIDSDSPLRP